MKICPRCYKEVGDVIGLSYPPVNDYHTCSPKVSKCCGDKASIVCGRHLYDPEGDDINIQRGKTYYYECKKCKEACDLIYG